MGRVLIIEDDQLIAEFMQRSLQIHGHKAVIARDAVNGYDKALSGGYDIIILDVLMPKMNGLEICQKLREQGLETSILIVSSEVSEDAQVQGLDAGADDYIVKPFGYKELNARVNALIRRRSAPKRESIKYGKFTYQGPNQDILYDNQPIELKPMEFSLLERLIITGDAYVSKEILLKEVWNVSPGSSSNRVEACIAGVRRALHAVSAPKSTIQTKRSRGYKLLPL